MKIVSIEEQIKYICNLEYTYINSEEDYYKLNKNINSLCLYFKINININKLLNTLIKFSYWTNNYLNNLPLNLKYLEHIKFNCNLPPKLLYLNCYWYDIYNYPRSLQFIYIIHKHTIAKELIDHHYNKNKLTFLNCYNYESLIKLNSIY